MSAVRGKPNVSKPSTYHGGPLSKPELQALVAAGVIERSGANPDIGLNTVKVHVGNVVWHSGSGPSSERTELSPGEVVRLVPGETITVVAQEEAALPLPPTLSGRLFPRGRLLPLGIFIPTTHVDPGFKGRFRVIIANVGSNIAEIPFGYEIARLELSNMSGHVEEPYHGVNSELQTVNPRADEIIVEWGSAHLHRMNDMLTRIRLLEDERARRLKWSRRKRRFAFAALTLVALAAVSAMGWGISTLKSGGATQTLLIQITAGVVVSAVVVVVATMRARWIPKVASWLRPTLETPGEN